MDALTEYRLEQRLDNIDHRIGKALHLLEKLLSERKPQLPTSIVFQEITMLPTKGGNTQIFTGSLVPAGSQNPSDAVYKVTSNDPEISPTVDPTGLIVTGPLPMGWVESATLPLAYSYSASSVGTPSWSLSATITPSAPPVLSTGITFAQTT